MSKNISNFSYSFLLTILSVIVYGQSQEITGTILDGSTGESIPGATILLKGTDAGTITDYDGTFTFKVNSLNDTLLISFVGFTPMEVPIDGRTVINESMGINNNQLDEIVVIGYGRQKKKVVTGAVARISDDDIKSTPALRIEQALQGRTPGVQVTAQSGQPGDEPTVRVRGLGTTGNAKPLYIVDGLAVGGIDYLNPGDIETIDVLKDAASAAIYGARAANGVILITTKSGAKGKLNVSYDTYYGWQNTVNRLEMLGSDDYKMLMNEGARNGGFAEPFDLLAIAEHNTDWQDELFLENVPMQNHQISVGGGNDKSTFASSISYFSQQGIIGGEKSQFDRYTARINSNHKVNKMLTFGNNLAYTHLIKRGIGTNTSFNGAYGSALNLDPLTPAIETSESELNTYPYSLEPVVTNSAGQTYGISRFVAAEIVNPLALIEIDNDETRKDQLVGNIYGELEIIKNLKIKTSLGIDLAYLIDDGFRPLFYLNGAQLNDNKTSVSKHIQRFYSWQWENTIAYEKTFNEDHTLGLLAGTTAFEFNYENLFGFNAKVPTNDPENVYLNLATDTVWTANGGAAHSALLSYFGRANYSYKDKYSVTTILRRDGSSKFGPNSRFGIFPSVGLAWVISDEDFLSNRLGPINYLKMRASWGVNGNQEIGDYQFLSTINQGRGYAIGGGTQTGASPNFLENNDIRWEESEQYNVGLDFGLFENKMQATLDYYIKNTNGLLERIPIPGHVGNDGPVANVGSVQNKGIEWSVDWRSVKGDFKYFVGFNGAFNINEVTFIGNSEKIINGAGWALAGAVTRAEEGQPIGFFWGYTTDGIFQNEGEVFSHINLDGELLQPNAVPGDVRFVDFNGDGEINDDDRTKIGDPNPDMNFGFNASVDYKGFDVAVFLQGTYGNDIFNGTQRQDLRYTNRPVSILDRWTGEGTSDSAPRYSWSDTNNNYRVSDLYIEDGSYVRLKNVQVGYSLPQSIRSRIGAEAFRIFISGENLLTFTNYTGVDPEIGALNGSNGAPSAFDIGIDRAVYPQAKTYRIGLSVTF